MYPDFKKVISPISCARKSGISDDILKRPFSLFFFFLFLARRIVQVVVIE
jgi:hypothetical protein